jgi:hypothetical protein
MLIDFAYAICWRNGATPAGTASPLGSYPKVQHNLAVCPHSVAHTPSENATQNKQIELS